MIKRWKRRKANNFTYGFYGMRSGVCITKPREPDPSDIIGGGSSNSTSIIGAGSGD